MSPVVPAAGVGRDVKVVCAVVLPEGNTTNSTNTTRTTGTTTTKKAHQRKIREALALGWHYRRRALKHRYAWFEDRRMADRCRYAFLLYPKPLRLVRSARRAAERAWQCCLVCAQPITVLRSTRTTCSTDCRVKLYRDRQRSGPRRLGRYRNEMMGGR